jgi:hypothetical protein
MLLMTKAATQRYFGEAHCSVREKFSRPSDPPGENELVWCRSRRQLKGAFKAPGADPAGRCQIRDPNIVFEVGFNELANLDQLAIRQSLDARVARPSSCDVENATCNRLRNGIHIQ